MYVMIPKLPGSTHGQIKICASLTDLSINFWIWGFQWTQVFHFVRSTPCGEVDQQSRTDKQHRSDSYVSLLNAHNIKYVEINLSESNVSSFIQTLKHLHFQKYKIILFTLSHPVSIFFLINHAIPSHDKSITNLVKFNFFFNSSSFEKWI